MSDEVRKKDILHGFISLYVKFVDVDYNRFPQRSFPLQVYMDRYNVHLTSSLRTPKFFVKEFSYFLMPCHQHGLRINLLVQR